MSTATATPIPAPVILPIALLADFQVIDCEVCDGNQLVEVRTHGVHREARCEACDGDGYVYLQGGFR